MNNAFKIEDLKAGMLIQYRNGKFRLVVPYGYYNELLLIGDNREVLELLKFNDNLTYIYDVSFDIVRVYSQSKQLSRYLDFTPDDRTLLWERKDKEQIRKENIKKKNEMLEQREKLIKQVNDLEIQIDTIEESYKKFMDENFKGDSAYYIPDDFKQQVIVISKDRISNGYKIRL